MRKQYLTHNVSGYEDSKTLLARLRKEETDAIAKAEAEAKVAAEKPLKDLENETTKTLVTLNKFRRLNMDVPSDELISRCAAAKEWGSLEEYRAAALKAVQVGLAAISVSETDKEVLLTLGGANGLMIDLTLPETWRTLWEWAIEIGSIQKPAVEKSQPQPNVKQEPTVTFDEILANNSTESRAGRKIIVNAVKQEVRQETTQAYAQFEREVKENFGGQLTNDEKISLATIMDARNFNSTSVKDWHRARVLGVKSGVLRKIYESEDELMAREMESGKIPMDTFEQRRDFQRKVAQLHKSPVLLS